jgi:hypothetical protein
MAANNSSLGSSGSKNFYNVAYGALWGSSKEPESGYAEIDASDLKARTKNGESVDVRSKFIDKGTGLYAYKNSYQNITGKINSLDIDVTDNGKNLVLDLTDADGETSLVQIKLYSKYSENILNRLCTLSSFDKVYLAPYAIPNEFEIEENGRKKKIKNFNQGFSVKVNNVKIDMKYKHDNVDLPKTERIEDGDGNLSTSRVKRINFLLAEANSRFNKELPTAELVGSEPPF